MTRNVYLLLLSCLMLISAEGFGQGNSKKNGNNGNGNGNGPKKEKSVFPPYGNTGIGIRYPTEKLEVIGNAKISQTLFANELDVVGIRATTLSIGEDATIGRNLLVNGSVGIGVADPSEKLDIDGSIRISQSLFSNQVSTVGLSSVTGAFVGRLTAGENVLISGLTGMGVSEPTERLEVAGNIKATQQLIAVGLQAETGALTRGLTVGEDVLVSGNVGIGVATPAEKLDVAGNIRASGALNANQLTVEEATTGTLQVNETVKVQGVALFDTKIGIGVSAPSEALDVAGNIRALGNMTASTLSSEGLNTANATVSDALTVSGTTTTNALEATDFSVANQTAQNIRTTQLAVNTDNIPSGYAVAVDGKVIASQVEVFAPENWPDYVFEDNYRLRSLEEVNAYIQQHGHLPNLPSAREMQQGGYSVSQMDANLLEKIEELTLYMIELKRENEALKTQVQQLSK